MGTRYPQNGLPTSVGCMSVMPGVTAAEHRHTLHRRPGIYWAREYVEDGGLMTYGASTDELRRRAATYVDKILKGADPANLPVEQPTIFQLFIGLKTPL
jgi:ABC-type uncharacterized transport system substrate-binding protein